MKTLWIAAVLSALMLVGCKQDHSLSLTVTKADCNDVTPDEQVDPGLACFEAERHQLTALSFGDSISLGYAGDVRHDLCGLVDFRHDDWADGDIDVCGEKFELYWIGAIVNMGHNDGCSATLLNTVQQVLGGQHYNVITFNIGLHDIQSNKDSLCGQVPLSDYRHHLEAISTIIAEHADVVIWIDTTPIPVGAANEPVGEEKVYNPVADSVAREHGFYMLSLDSVDQLPDDIHYRDYTSLGKQVADCILDALAQDETASCHH